MKKVISVLDNVDSTLASPAKFLRALRTLCVLCVLSCVNFSMLGCEEKSSSYSLYGDSPATDSVVDTSYNSVISSSSVTHDTISHATVEPIAEPKTEPKAEPEVEVKPIKAYVVPEDPIIDTPVVKKKVKSPSSSIASSQKTNKSPKGNKFRYNLPCKKKIVITKGLTAWKVCKKYKIDYAELLAINKPGIVEKFRVGNLLCLARVE